MPSLNGSGRDILETLLGALTGIVLILVSGALTILRVEIPLLDLVLYLSSVIFLALGVMILFACIRHMRTLIRFIRA